MKNDDRKLIIVVASVIGAVVIASTGHDGWGWLVTLAILAMCA